MAAKFNVNREDLYVWDSPETKERTRARLQEMADLGMEEVGVADFGVPGIMSGLYIEKVWNYSDKAWADYIAWVKELITEKNR